MSMTVEEMLVDYDWEEVFKYAREPAAVPGFTGSTAGFERSDVTKIVATVNGANDESEWLGAFKLKDGRWASIRAGCDFTGWG